MSWRVERSALLSLVLWISSPRLASAAEESTFFIVKDSMCITLLSGDILSLGAGGLEGSLGWKERKKRPPARDRACKQERYEASLWMCSSISLTWYHTISSGWLKQYYSR